jgi:hypothetical protein
LLDLGNRKYEIKEVYSVPKSKEVEKMMNGMYRYIVPLILLKLIEGHDENNRIALTSSKWAKQIHMINRNYDTVKYSRSEVARIYEWESDDVKDFFIKVDDMISSYLVMSLDYLKSTGSIIWREANVVHSSIPAERMSGYDENGKPKYELYYESEEHTASEEEMGFYTKCVEIADNEAGIEKGRANKRYYGDESKIFSLALARELNSRNIKYIYKTYEVYFIHLDWCKSLLKEFDINKSIDDFIKEFNIEFQSLIMRNANTRYDKDVKNVILKYSEKYLDIFTNLCDITINHENDKYNIKQILKLEDSKN